MHGDSNGGNGNGEIGPPAGVAKDANVVDVSMSAVNARLRQFIAEVRARPEGEPLLFRESDAMLASWAEQALEAQEAAERKLAEAEREALESRGGRVQ